VLFEAGLTAGSFTNEINRRTVDIINGVIDGEFAAGVAEANELAGSPSLQVLTNMCSPNFLWVGTIKLPPDVARALKKSLLALRDLQILGNVPGLTGFMEPRLEDYAKLEERIEKARQFDAPQLRR
jgi:ABC-type phosphate/phosphonate transport system substrate-binding protein